MAHHGLLALVVPAVRDHFAGHADAVGQNVDVLVLGVSVATYDILAVVVAHALQVGMSSPAPLFVCKRLPWWQADADVTYRLCQIWPQGPHLSELTCQGARIASGHIRFQQVALALAQVVIQGSPEATALNQLRNH